MNKLELGQKIPRIAKERKQTLETLAEAADIGLVYLGEIERGIKMPSLKTFIKLVNALDVSADELIGLKPNPVGIIIRKSSLNSSNC